MSDEQINTLFPTDNQKDNQLRGITRENALARLAREACPRCAVVGKFSLFNKAMHTGIVCSACGREHVFRSRGVMWLPSLDNAWKRGTL